MKQSKTIFVTGGSSGLGKAIYTEALKAGHKIITTFRKQDQVDEFNQNHDNEQALAVLMDITNAEQVKQGVNQALDKFKQIDVLINNAGMGVMKLFESLSTEDLNKQYQVNVFGILNLTKEILPSMRKHQSGHIYNISSVVGITGMPSIAAYSSSKFAVEGLSLCLREEVKDFNIKVTLIEPGAFDTSFMDNATINEMMESAPAAYSETAKNIKKAFEDMPKSDETGDAQKLAKVLIEAIKTDENYTHIPMGKDAIESFKEKIKVYQNVVDTWESTTSHLAKKDAEVQFKFSK
jgi:NADP-dependent 3-hydroxy acid dehydrogenase YdfG